MPLGDDCCFCFFFSFSVNNVRVNYSRSGNFLRYDSSLTFCFEKKAWMVSDVFFLKHHFSILFPLCSNPNLHFFEGFFCGRGNPYLFLHKSPGDPGGADAEADAPAAPTETAPAGGPGPKGV